MQNAAHELSATLVTGFAQSAAAIGKTIVGLQVLTGTTGDEVENLRQQIEQLDAQIANKQASLTGAVGQFAQELRTDIAALQATRNILARQQLTAAEKGPRSAPTSLGFDTRLPGGDLPGFDVGDLEVLGDIRKDLAEFQRIENIVPGANDAFIKRFQDFIESFDQNIQSGVVDSAQEAAASIEQVGDALGEKILGKSKQMSVFAEEAARNIQGAFADFLFDPFEGGLKGMLKGFVDVLRRMVAEAAAAQIFEKLFGSSSTSGTGNALGSFLSGIFGASASGGNVPSYAVGTNYVPHDQLAMVHKGEAIIPAAMNGMGGMTVNYNVDARGATADAIKSLPEVLRRNNDALEARIIQRMRSGKYGV